MGQFIKSAFLTILLIAGGAFLLKNRSTILSGVQSGVDGLLSTVAPTTPDPKAPQKVATPKPDVAAPTLPAETPVAPTAEAAVAAPVAPGEGPATDDPVAEVKVDPAFQAFQKTDGNAHIALIEDLGGAFQAGKTQTEIEAIKSTYLKDVLKRFGAYASTDSLVAFNEEQLRIGRTLQKSDVALCAAFATDNPAMRSTLRKMLSVEDRAALSQALAAVLESATAQPAGIGNAEKVPETLKTLMGDLAKTYGQDLTLLDPARAYDPAADKTKVCAIALDFVAAVQALPKEDAADVTRVSFTQTQPDPPVQPAAAQPAPAAEPVVEAPAVTVTDLELQNVDQELVKQPFFQAIAAAEPESYRDFVIEVAQAAKGAELVAVVDEKRAALARNMLRKYLPLTTDDALISYFKMLTTVNEKIGTQDPVSCYSFFSTGELPANAVILLSQNDQRQLLQVTANVIKNGAGKQPRETDLGVVQASMNDVLTKVAPESAAILGKASQGEQPQPSAGCQANVDLYKQVTRLPRAKAAPVLRTFLPK